MAGFVLITPAHNEELLVDKLAESVINQSLRPLRWVVVDDGSSDRTAALFRKWSLRHRFIEVVEIQRAAGRHFGNKVAAFNAGLSRMGGLPYGYVGNLDADITLDPDYFERLMAQFLCNPLLGIAGGMVHSKEGHQFVSQEVSLDSVAGAVQMFRRECFVQIGGYRHLPNGGIDAAAEIAARMHGWVTRTFPELKVLEHRKTGSAASRPLMSRVREGRRMHSLGYSPMFFLIRCLYRVFERPIIVGSAAAAAGFLGSAVRGEKAAIPREMVRFLRNEQRTKLRRLLGFRAA